MPIESSSSILKTPVAHYQEESIGRTKIHLFIINLQNEKKGILIYKHLLAVYPSMQVLPILDTVPFVSLRVHGNPYSNSGPNLYIFIYINIGIQFLRLSAVKDSLLLS